MTAGQFADIVAEMRAARKKEEQLNLFEENKE